MSRTTILGRRSSGDAEPTPWRAVVAGASASLVGIGLARFAYAPLLPAIVGAGWFSESAAAYLGAANLAGYLAGALIARPLAGRLPTAALLRSMMLLAAVAFLACGWPLSTSWFFAWRVASGVAGGALMVLAAPAVLPFVPAARRGLAAGAIFAGVGIGIAASGTLVPMLLREGLRETWLGLGFLALALTAVAWPGWPGRAGPATSAAPDPAPDPAPVPRLGRLYASYALNAAGLVPHMIFLVDFVARGLGQGVEAGARYWVLFGLGAMAGPVVTGRLADRIGFGRALRLALLVEAACVALPALGLGAAPLALSAVVVGAFTPGIVPLVLGRVHELLPGDPQAQKAAWTRATVGFALLQASGAYGMSWLFARAGGDYRLLFLLGAGALAAALAVDLASGARTLGLAAAGPLVSSRRNQQHAPQREDPA